MSLIAHLIDDTRHADARERHYQRQVLRYYDCRDPEHPGCEDCEPIAQNPPFDDDQAVDVSGV